MAEELGVLVTAREFLLSELETAVETVVVLDRELAASLAKQLAPELAASLAEQLAPELALESVLMS